MTNIDRRILAAALLLTTGISLVEFCVSTRVEARQSAPRYLFDPAWPQPLRKLEDGVSRVRSTRTTS